MGLRLLTKISAICVTLVAGFAGLLTPMRPNFNNYQVQKSNEMIVRDLKAFKCEDDLSMKYNNESVRFLIPKDREVVVEVSASLPEKFYTSTVNATNKLNEVFAVVNPDLYYTVYRQGENDKKPDITIISRKDMNLLDKAYRENNRTYAAVLFQADRMFRLAAYNNITNAKIICEDLSMKMNENGLSQCLLHELCHTLGLNDKYEGKYAGESIMYGYLRVQPETKFYLKDVKTLSALYGKTDEYGYEHFNKLFENKSLVYNPQKAQEAEPEMGE